MGPHENMNEALYTIIESIVTTLSEALPKVRATPKAPIAMPTLPVMSNGLRPKRSTVNTAISVNRMLTTPITTVCTIGFSMPISPNMRGA